MHTGEGCDQDQEGPLSVRADGGFISVPSQRRADSSRRLAYPAAVANVAHASKHEWCGVVRALHRANAVRIDRRLTAFAEAPSRRRRIASLKHT